MMRRSASEINSIASAPVGCDVLRDMKAPRDFTRRSWCPTMYTYVKYM